MSGELRRRLQADLTLAVKARDGIRASVLRTTLAAIANAEAVDPDTVPERATEVPRRDLADADIRALVEAEERDLVAHARRLTDLEQMQRADELAAKAAILRRYLDGRD